MEAVTPLCPYCGEWNGHPDGVEMVAMYSGYYDKECNCYLRCPVCRSTSPSVRLNGRTISEADKLMNEYALRRFRPMQKPMTLEEIKEIITPFPIWLEMKTSAFIAPVIFKYNFASKTIELFRDVRSKELREEDYGINWRGWWQNPTIEELYSAAAKWEENDQ